MIYSHAKLQGQWSVGSEDKVETSGRIEATALPATLIQSVITNHGHHYHGQSFKMVKSCRHAHISLHYLHVALPTHSDS